MVLAENSTEAERVAWYGEREEISEPDQSHATEVTSLADIPEEWHDGIPYGSDIRDEKTCQQIMGKPK